MNFFYGIFYYIFRGFFRIFYHHKIFGKEHICPGPAIIASNHLSYWDPPLLGTSCPEEVYYIARATLFDHPMLRYFITRLNAYPIKGSPHDLASFKLVSKFLEENKKVILFPEGKRSADGKLMEFKTGIAMLAHRSNSPIIPAYIHGTFEIWNRGRKFPKLWGRTACVFGSPIMMEAFSHLPKKEAHEAITHKVRESVENLRRWYENGAQGVPP